MSNGLITPGLVVEAFEAGEDLVITPQELSGLVETTMGTVMGVFSFGLLVMIITLVTNNFLKEVEA